MQRSDVTRWIADYERLWRTDGTAGLPALFADAATYVPSPWTRRVVGIAAIADFWESERDGPDEDFALSAEIVAVDGDTAVVRVHVDYADPDSGRWRDLWVLRLDEDGRCRWFEEWPFSPDQPDGHDAPPTS